jgi:anti-sigma regulatory factor (Ser/Thr protein kinase)
VLCNREAPCAVRAAIDDLEAIEDVREDARLVASELVTNAVVHSGCSATQAIVVTVKVRDESLVITVDDPYIAGHTAHMRGADHDPLRGRFGLRIVEQLSRDWGATRYNGLLVWAELALN